MRTTMDIPAKLVTDAMRSTGSKTKTETIILGLKELLRCEHIRSIRDFRGKVDIDVDINISRGR